MRFIAPIPATTAFGAKGSVLFLQPAQQFRFFGRELVIGEDALGLEVAQALQGGEDLGSGDGAAA
jgi:hypothetical protein